MARQKDPLSQSFGTYGNTVALTRKRPGGRVSVEYYDRDKKTSVRRALGHASWETGLYEARQLSEALACGEPIRSAPLDPTVVRLTALYSAVKTPRKGHGEQLEDARRIELWNRSLGPNTDLRRVMPETWQQFIDDRRSGAIDSRGRQVDDPAKRRPVRDTAIAGDLLWLRQLAGWAARRRDHDTGEPIMSFNPFLSDEYPIPREKNARHPVVTTARFQQLCAVADPLLRLVIEVCWFTGHRISAILALRIEDLRLGEPRTSSITWPAETDKMGQGHVVPIAEPLAASLKRYLAERSVIAGWLFPSKDPSKHLSKDYATKLLLDAEERAGLAHLPGGCWHPFRRAFATSRKGLPLTDLAAAGGWKNIQTLARHYLMADSDTLRRVVEGGTELREVRQG